MENTANKTSLWRRLIIIIPLAVIWIGWIFNYIHRYIFGWILIAGSSALITALIPIIFIRPLSGGTKTRVLRITARCLLFLVLTAVISLQCFAGIVFSWLAD